MKLLFLTTVNPAVQGDLFEVSILHGLRKLLGENCVDYPRKKIMYHDFSDTPKDSLHGRGFSLLTTPINDIPPYLRENIELSSFDAILCGDGHMYGEPPPEFQGNMWVIDGHDLYGNAPRKIIYNGEEVIGAQYPKSFKRELVEDLIDLKVFPSGFGIPEERIMLIDYSAKTQQYQKTAPAISLFEESSEMGGGFSHHKFTKETDYYDDINRSWFGLTCKKGGWDCLRHYEIIAGGALLLFRDYDKKHPLCSPQHLPCFSYSSKEELYTLMNKLVINHKPTQEYIDMILKQRDWLLSHGSTIARATHIINIISKEMQPHE
jgi:hypothetical protein